MGRQRSNDTNDVFRAAGQIYDPAADRWTPTPPLVEDRFGYTVTLLPDGRVLVVGNADSSSNGLASTELYDPDRNVWASNTPTTVPRYYHAATPLQDGRVLVLGGSGTTTAEVFNPTPAPQACFAETGHCMRGPFLAYWQAHGGLARNGYPLSDERIEVLEDGRAYQVQYFERVRLEYHPENDPPYDVLLGQFGRRVRPADPPAAPHPDQVYFAETGHNLGDGFLDYWRANGDLAQFGFPISEVVEQELDGTVYRVQYFERARFEYHSDNAAPYNILLGQFGRQILAEVDAGR
jgi:hypothetical protein